MATGTDALRGSLPVRASVTFPHSRTRATLALELSVGQHWPLYPDGPLYFYFWDMWMQRWGKGREMLPQFNILGIPTGFSSGSYWLLLPSTFVWALPAPGSQTALPDTLDVGKVIRNALGFRVRHHIPRDPYLRTSFSFCASCVPPAHTDPCLESWLLCFPASNPLCTCTNPHNC